MYHQPEIFKGHPVVAAESQRSGGTSPPPYTSLNLGINTDDDPACIIANREKFLEALGWPVGQFAHSYQVHGHEVLTVHEPGSHTGYDAIITNQPGLMVGVTIVKQAVAAVHAGWKGTVAKIVVYTLDKMKQEYGTAPEDCIAYIGTCISQPNYEVDERVASQFNPNHLKKGVQAGKWMADLKGANYSLLLQEGIKARNIEVARFCTWGNNDLYFSHRKNQGKTGRMLAVIGLT